MSDSLDEVDNRPISWSIVRLEDGSSFLSLDGVVKNDMVGVVD
jgi:hypothetical protein